MTLKIRKILEDLYLIDPELKNHEQVLEKLISELLKVKPNTEFDAGFARELKERILQIPQEEKVNKNYIKSFINLPMTRMIVALGGSALALVLILTALTTGGQFTANQQGRTLSLGGQKFLRVQSGAFGSLLASADGRGSAAESAPLGLGGDNASSAPVAGIATGRGGGGGVVGDAKMIAPPYPYVNYKYVYRGDPIELKDGTVDVYKRVQPQTDTSDMVGVLTRLGFGGLNLNSFSGANLSNFELIQKTKDGYVVNINVGEGMVSINQNWMMWTDCVNGRDCPVPAPISMSDIPSDEQLIAVADQFLKDHNIDMANYGKGEVENEWKRMYTIQSPETMPQYVPESIQVVYPLKIQENEVYEMYGGKKGVRVNIDVRKNKVSGAWQIMSQDYQVSSYAAETDSARIQKIAENGGVYGGPIYYYEKDSNVKEVEVELQTPQKVLVSVWSNNSEVIVPALRFNVKAPADNPNFWPATITVPLVKDILDTYSNPGPIRVMDAIPASGAGTSSGSAVSEPAKPTPTLKPEFR